MSKKTVAVDFDGVLNLYNGWQGEDELFQPRENAQQFLALLAADYEVIIHSTRSPTKIRRWLDEHGLAGYVADVTSVKPPAVAYVDDRAVRFEGDFGDVLVELSTFKPYWERQEEHKAAVAQRRSEGAKSGWEVRRAKGRIG